VFGVSLGISKLPECFTDLYNDWFNAHSCRDRQAVTIGSVEVVWAVWKTRNKSVFQSTRPGDPTNIIIFAFQLIKTSSKLQKSELRNLLFQGARKN
jgi:hypothetical protein